MSHPPCRWRDPTLEPSKVRKLLAEITNRIVSLARKHYGRGPIKAKTYVLDDPVVCVLTDVASPPLSAR